MKFWCIVKWCHKVPTSHIGMKLANDSVLGACAYICVNKDMHVCRYSCSRNSYYFHFQLCMGSSFLPWRGTTHIYWPERKRTPWLVTQQEMLSPDCCLHSVWQDNGGLATCRAHLPWEDKAGMLLSKPVDYPASTWDSRKAGSPAHSAAALVCPTCSQGN